MIAKLVAAAILYWLLKPRGEPSVSVGDDWLVDFKGDGSGHWSDAYKAKPGDPPG